MAQLNIHITEEFEKALLSYMRIRGLKTKSEAVRQAVREGLALAVAQQRMIDHSQWIGIGNQAPQNDDRRFSSEDELWEDS